LLTQGSTWRECWLALVGIVQGRAGDLLVLAEGEHPDSTAAGTLWRYRPGRYLQSMSREEADHAIT
jgi:hypothetical protein